MFDLALKILTAIGIPTIIGVCIYIGKKLGVLDTLEKGFEKIIDKVDDVDRRVSKIEGKLFGVAISSSPIRLTPLGQEILQNSGILEILKNKKQSLVENIKQQNLQTAYDVQEIVKSLLTVDKLHLTTEEENRLKNYAFSKGTTLKEVLYAGAIYFRDVVLEELGFKIEDLDNK